MACIGDDVVLDVLEGTVAEADRADVLAHIEACEDCRATLATAMTLDCDVGETRSEGPPLRFGRYVVEDFIGEGAMGVVYRAHDPQIDRDVALKIVPPEHCTPGRRARLLEEARALGRLNHPNVLTVFDAGVDGSTVFIASELVDGCNLRAWLAQTPRSLAAILEVFSAAGRGLAAAHRAQLVHLDFKPDNVLVAADTVKVADFGLAQRSGAAGEACGTDGYRAPEQRAGRRVDARADQFAFCASLAEALEGHAGPVPSELRELVERGRAPEPGDRFADFDALLAGLHPPPAARPRRWIATTAVAVAVAALGVIGYGVVPPGDADASPTSLAATPAPALARARALRSEGALVEAARHARRVATDARAEHDPALEAEARLLLGKLLFATEGHTAASDALWSAVALARDAQRHDLEAESLIALASVDAEDPTAGRRAIALVADARRRLEGNAAAPRLLPAADYAEGRVHFVIGRHEAALASFERALRGATEALSDDHPYLAQYRVSVGNALGRLARHQDARAIYLDAMERAAQSLGSNTARYAMMLSEIAAAEANTGEYEVARQDYERALAILVETLGNDSRLARQTRAARAFCLAQLGRTDEARAEFRSIVQASLVGAEPVDIIRAYHDLGDVELGADDPAGALVAYQQARRWAEREVPATPLHARTLTRIAIATMNRAADTSVRDLLEDSLLIHEVEGGDAIDRAEAEFALAQAVVHETGEHHRGHALATRAATRLVDGPGLDGERRRAIEQWLRAQFGDASIPS